MTERPKPGAAFRESSFAGDAEPVCIEVGIGPDEVLLRDAKNPAGPVLHFTVEEWRAFVGGVQSGEFDLS
jgi:Domain of unknown function (DUF397)